MVVVINLPKDFMTFVIKSSKVVFVIRVIAFIKVVKGSIYHGIKIKITYVKNGRIEVVSTGYLRTKNPLELPDELMKKVRQANVSHQYIYQNWQTYKTIDVVRNVLNKKETYDEVDKK